MIAGAVVGGGRIACLVPMADACARRADIVRAHAERLEVRGQSTTDLDIIAHRIAWDAHAAGEYPRPMLSDAVDLQRVRPELAQVMWHHVAGATILGPGCCGTPASHRDALVELARALRGAS